MTENLQGYSKICDDCAKKEGGVCHKEIVCYCEIKCEICGKEAACLSARDWNLPLNK